MAKLKFPVWLIAPADSMDISPLDLATFKNGSPQWVTVSCKGVSHLAAFTSEAGAQAFAARAFSRPQDYVNAEMEPRDLRLALERILRFTPVERLLLDEKHGFAIAPLLERLRALPQAGEDFEKP